MWLRRDRSSRGAFERQAGDMSGFQATIATITDMFGCPAGGRWRRVAARTGLLIIGFAAVVDGSWWKGTGADTLSYLAPDPDSLLGYNLELRLGWKMGW
jgi:hypothetical protein